MLELIANAIPNDFAPSAQKRLRHIDKFVRELLLLSPFDKAVKPASLIILILRSI